VILGFGAWVWLVWVVGVGVGLCGWWGLGGSDGGLVVLLLLQ